MVLKSNPAGTVCLSGAFAWRGAIAWLFALIVAASPIIEAYTCAGEGLLTSSDSVVTAADLDHHAPVAPDNDGDGACIHGHCHHFAAMIAPIATPQAAAPEWREHPGPPPRAAMALPESLERPPRA
jgi:hypothetical protein